MKVYLAGPINGKSDEECFSWRVTARRVLTDHEILCPTRRDYRGIEEGNGEAIVVGDLADISEADVVFVYAVEPSWGTAMEVVLAAREFRKRVVAYCPALKPSPWLAYHADIYRTFHGALEAV